ncbi:MAG: class I SAM-dependent methyltransferase [Hyphomicrobiales bacterium]
MSGAPEPSRYDAGRAAGYWSGPRFEFGDELAAVLSLGEPRHVNQAYDAWETGLLLDALAEAGVPLAGAVAVDVGAGVGRVAVRVAPLVGKLVAGDLAAGMLGRLRRNAARAGVPNALPVRFRSDRLPLRDGAASLVLCLGLLEHLPPESRRATLREAARVLRPGGLLALVLNNEESRFLRDPGDNPHRVGSQRENGYYCAVVGDRAVLAEAAADFRATVLGANLHYSLHRHASRLLEDDARRDPRLAPFFERAAAWDRVTRPQGPLARAAADHHLHLLVRR